MIIKQIQTPVGAIPIVPTKLSNKDFWGTVRVRWLIGRDNYTVNPGLYGVGEADENSDVFVTANYKLSFDHLRKNLDGLNAWILVLDTKGVNVWCAAGKGTFGTNELVHRIKETQLEKIVNHNRIIVPQLGATGVSAHQVKKLMSSKKNENNNTSIGIPSNFNFNDLGKNVKLNQGFRVVFGPVHASGIKAFIKNRYRTTDEMRKVNFSFYERLKLTPVDMVYNKYKLLGAFALIFLLSAFNHQGIDFAQATHKGLQGIFYVALAYLAGIVITPALLPYIPAKMFAFKGLIAGLIVSSIILFTKGTGASLFENLSWFLIIPSISSFMAMNFTGSSTFTSLSGVKKEMKIFVPIQIVFAVAGLVLFTVSNFKL